MHASLSSCLPFACAFLLSIFIFNMEPSVEAGGIPLSWKIRLLNKARTLNIFDSQSNDVGTIHRERLSTRLYILLLSLLIFSIVLYAAFTLRTTIVTVSKPSEQNFRHLYTYYSNTIQCPCSQVTIQYSKFIQSQATLHEVCNSELISQPWIDGIYGANVSFVSPTDVRTILSAFWQWVRSFCDLARGTLIDVYTDLNSNLLLSPTAQPQYLIEAKVEASRRFSLTSAGANLRRDLLINHDMTLGNGLFSGLGTNYYFQTSNGWAYGIRTVSLEPISFADGCSCANFNGCLRPAVLYSSNNTTNATKVPGMMFDCLPMDGILASSLECFYYSTCLSMILQESSITIRPSLLSWRSHFPRNATLQTLADELMIENVTTAVFFSSYYAECRPSYCAYSYSRRFDWALMITLVASAFGGVSLFLRLITPWLIRVALFIHGWKKRPRAVDGSDIQQPKLVRMLFRYSLRDCSRLPPPVFLKMYAVFQTAN